MIKITGLLLVVLLTVGIIPTLTIAQAQNATTTTNTTTTETNTTLPLAPTQLPFFPETEAPEAIGNQTETNQTEASNQTEQHRAQSQKIMPLKYLDS